MSLVERADLALRRFDGAAALALYEELAANGDSSDQVVAGRIRALWSLRRWQEARDLVPRLTDSLDRQLVLGLIALGQPDDPQILTLDCGSYGRDENAALEAFGVALEMDSTCDEALAGYAAALRMSGRAAEGVEMLTGVATSAAPVLIELALSAYEREDFAGGLQYVERIEDDGPDRIRKHLMRLFLVFRSGGLTSALIQEMENLEREVDPPPAALLESYGWMLFEYADKAREPADRREAALAKFTRSIDTGPAIPGAVNGRALILNLTDHAAAVSLVKEAIAREPTSPQLSQCLADLKAEASSSPSDRLLDYRKALELDPRLLRVRLQLAAAHRGLGETAEADAILEKLSAEFPGNDRVAREIWDQGWQSADVSVLAKRVDRPWEEGRDAPDAILALLSNEVVEKFSMPREVETRVRDRVRVDANEIFQRAYEHEREYLRTKEEHRRQTERARRAYPFWLLSYVVVAAGAAAVLAATGFAIWQLGELVGLSTGWSWVLTVGVVVAVVLIWSYMVSESVGDDGVTILVLLCLTALAIVVIQTIRWFGVGWGIGAAVGVLVVMVVLVGGAFAIIGEFEKPNWQNVQQVFDRWLEMLYGKGILPIATEVSGQQGSAYNTVLPARSRIVSDEEVDIDTEASRELSQLLTQRTKGSFALAGPRGAGKSSLLSRWCAGQFLREHSGEQEQRRDLTLRVDAPVGYQSKDFLVHLFGRLCDAVEKYAKDHESAIAELWSQSPARPSRLVRAFSTELDRGRRTAADQPFDLLRAATQERHRLRYQQSRTSEGELSLGVPPVGGTKIGVKGKVSVRRDEVALTHPELVDRFRDFLGSAAGVVSRLNGKVLIGIDELDRISDGAAAQTFLNELKAVFAVPNCYFLVSVSEDALADFDLSAMGMRTVFDSAFDTIVRVDYLNFHEAKQLLNRRILDLPEQFAALAYVLAGGLARELVRTVEAIGNPKEAEKRELAAVAANLAQRQLHRTTRAAMDRLNRSADRRYGARLIRLLDEHPADTLTSPELRRYARALADDLPPKDEPDLIDNVRQHAAVVAEYLAVLLAVFDDRLDEARMERGTVSGPGNFETLARVRRYLGANPYGARELLRGFSEAWGLGS